ncbi:MAG: class I SAM-dependent methyltransferase [candidate division Zixibacteria bacterium]|nr:class I SAM-dependent methyltransferase [candidate division Zixibacteria bacterium]
MTGYYDKNLSAEKLKKVYEVAPPRTRQYLQAEIDFVLKNIKSADSVLELGCGYGRVLKPLAQKAQTVFGIDSSQANIVSAKKYLSGFDNIQLHTMNASELAFEKNCFNKVICIQNGISAFHVDPEKLINETLRVLKPEGSAFFSSYSEKFWEDRLEWFKIQSENNLLGEIDWGKTKNGKIICTDGFSATTFSSEDFINIMLKLKLSYNIKEIDNSSVFCIISKVN